MSKSVKLIVLLFMANLVANLSNAQVGINILQPDSSAILHLESTDRGFLPPRLTTAQRDAINNPKPGLLVYNTQDSLVQYYNGECWLNAWQRNCADCAVDFSLASYTATIDRIFTFQAQTEVYINQVAGDPTNIVLYIFPGLPPGITATLDNYVVNGSDTLMLTVDVSIFTQPGTYPIIVSAVCGNTTATQAFVVTVEPCIIVDIISNQVNYNLQANNGLPTATPICVVATVYNGVQITSTQNNDAFTTGNLHPQSQVGLINDGALLARGGNGAFGGNFSQFGNPGDPGMDALNLTVATTIQNTGYIYGGGGGGGSVGVGVNIPVVNINLGIGAGGGGGAASGQGGQQSLPIPVWANGQNATGGLNGQGGDGGLLNFTIPIGFPPVNVNVTPNAYGGDGGGYGQAGSGGTLFVNVVAQVQIPFIGNVTVLNINLPDPPPSSFPAGGAPGHAIRRNGNPVNGVLDGNYQTTFIKGVVGP